MQEYITEAGSRRISAMFVTDGTTIRWLMMRDVDPYEDTLGHSTVPGDGWRLVAR